MEGEGAGVPRYAAFLSYSHQDSAFARRLHRRLEGYRIPRRLAGQVGDYGIVPDRLNPIFRDREELAAAGDLSERVSSALAGSRALIVICSPAAAASSWVAREIEAFREIHPSRPVLAAIIEGDPADSFPHALRQASGVAGAEPIAADFRPSGDGWRLGFLKLVAGLSGLELDKIVQRDAQRRLQRVTAVTVTALAALLIMSLLAVTAWRARLEAERQRSEAEGMVEFMLTDLRERLEGVGRLDVLTAVNERALVHYQRQDLRALQPDALERRARLLHAMGEDDQNRGELQRALRQFEEASRTTAELLAQEPHNAERMFSHGQSAFWVGSVAYERGDTATARRAFNTYKALSDRLVELDPANRDWLREAAYADGNICTLALDPPPDLKLALQVCRSALSKMEAAARRSGPLDLAKDLANRHAWLADAYRKTGQLLAALRHRQLQHGHVTRLVSQDPQNRKLQASLIWASRAIANVENDLGRRAEARKRMALVEVRLAELVAHDPENKDWRDELGAVRQELSQIQEEDR